MTLLHAKIEIEGQEDRPILCTFNPDKLTYIKSNTWTPQPATGRHLPPMGFGGGHPATLKAILIFDRTEDSEESGKDVRDISDRLVKLMKVDEHLKNKISKGRGGGGGGQTKSQQHRPPTCTFSWGHILSFRGALQTLQIEYVLFLPDGKPVRANATCTFVQVEDEDLFPNQNPTSGGRTGERIHRLEPRETLEHVAYQAFGSTALWRSLAAFNGVDDPLRLHAGDELLLPASADDLKAYG
jgi:hypothetical protein